MLKVGGYIYIQLLLIITKKLFNIYSKKNLFIYYIIYAIIDSSKT